MLVRTEKGERETNVVDTVLAVASSHVAIAWLLAKARRSSTALLPILGSRTRAQLDATLSAVNLQLTNEKAARLDVASAIALGSPHDMIAGSAMGIAGGSSELLRAPFLPAK